MQGFNPENKLLIFNNRNYNDNYGLGGSHFNQYGGLEMAEEAMTVSYTHLLVMLSGTGQNTLPIAQLHFQTQFGTNYNLAFASYLLALIPIIIFYIICQKQIIKGVVNGAVK